MVFRLAYFVSHPIQYQAPLLKLISADRDIDLKVFFYSDFSVSSYKDPEFAQYIQWDTILTEGYDFQYLNCWGSKQWKGALQQPIARNTIQHLKEGKFDAIWVHGWYHAASIQVILAANQLGIPVFLRGESNGIETDNNPAKQAIKRIFLNWLFQKVEGFLYVGSLNKDFYKSYGIDDTRLFLMPYAVDNNYFQKQTEHAHSKHKAFRQSLGLNSHRPIILYVAKLIERKRPQDLLAAYRLMSTDGIKEPEPYLIFIGDGALRPHLEAIATDTGWQSIKFFGFKNQSELPAWYNLCDVFVLPSTFEPWGLAVNEAMNAGKAIVVSDKVGCAADLVVQQHNGYVYPSKNINALKSALRWALDNSSSAGKSSLQQIQRWSFSQDLAGLKKACFKSSNKQNRLKAFN